VVVGFLFHHSISLNIPVQILHKGCTKKSREKCASGITQFIVNIFMVFFKVFVLFFISQKTFLFLVYNKLFSYEKRISIVPYLPLDGDRNPGPGGDQE
jgi:hypothetical protein